MENLLHALLALLDTICSILIRKLDLSPNEVVSLGLDLSNVSKAIEHYLSTEYLDGS